MVDRERAPDLGAAGVRLRVPLVELHGDLAYPAEPPGGGEPLEQFELRALDVHLQEVDGVEPELVEHGHDVADPRGAVPNMPSGS